jgi:hypothetical protein
MPANTLNPTLAAALTDARRQTHHAAQFATAAGISFLPHQPDDSHTNLEWITSLGALASRVVPGSRPFRLAVRVSDLTLLILDGNDAMISTLPLHGRTIADTADWIRARLTDLGVDGRKYTLTRHYSIPVHPVADGAAFDASDTAAFEQLGRWMACGAEELESLKLATAGASDVRCWPHHFDIATLIDLGSGKSIGIGFEPGDAYYDEPYFYVNMYPYPPAETALPQLDGNGTWHTHEWVGAVLSGSRVDAGDGQRTQITAFLTSAVGAARSLVAN